MPLGMFSYTTTSRGQCACAAASASNIASDVEATVRAIASCACCGTKTSGSTSAAASFSRRIIWIIESPPQGKNEWPPFPLVANIIWMLDDFTDDNGATRFIPGSHHEDHADWTPESIGRRGGETVAVGGSAGSLVCLDGRVLHQTGANTTDDELRHGVIAYYCQPWIRQQENASLSILPHVWPALSPTLRGLGSVSGPTQRGFRY